MGAITYPRSIPPAMVIERVRWGGRSAVAIAESPFTFDQQVQEHQGQRWAGTVTVSPCESDAGAIIAAWGLSLRGRSKTFLMGDPMRATPRGTAASAPGVPRVSGASQRGASVRVDGCPASAVRYLLPGDYVQIDDGTAARLHMIMATVVTTAAGSAVFDIWPSLRGSPNNDASIHVASARGTFRLAINQFDWDESTVIYGFTFDAVEAV